jgi:hypothetical protein
VALTHASELLETLAKDQRLARLDSFHLIGDMELDEDLRLLAIGARSAGFRVLDFRLPRLWPEGEDLFDALRSSDDDSPRAHDRFQPWRQANPQARDRLCELAGAHEHELILHDPAHEGALLAMNEWVYLGDALKAAGVWAVAKSHQDLEDEDNRCRRLALLPAGRESDLCLSPYFHAEVT